MCSSCFNQTLGLEEKPVKIFPISSYVNRESGGINFLRNVRSTANNVPQPAKQEQEPLCDLDLLDWPTVILRHISYSRYSEVCNRNQVRQTDRQTDRHTVRGEEGSSDWYLLTTACIATSNSHAMNLCSQKLSDVLIVWEEHAVRVITGFTCLTLKLRLMSAAEKKSEVQNHMFLLR